jgi:hypothetical protein
LVQLIPLRLNELNDFSSVYLPDKRNVILRFAPNLNQAGIRQHIEAEPHGYVVLERKALPATRASRFKRRKIVYRFRWL